MFTHSGALILSLANVARSFYYLWIGDSQPIGKKRHMYPYIFRKSTQLTDLCDYKWYLVTISCQFITFQQMERSLPKQEYWYWQESSVRIWIKIFFYTYCYTMQKYRYFNIDKEWKYPFFVSSYNPDIFTRHFSITLRRVMKYNNLFLHIT